MVFCVVFWVFFLGGGFVQPGHTEIKSCGLVVNIIMRYLRGRGLKRTCASNHKRVGSALSLKKMLFFFYLSLIILMLCINTHTAK